MEQVLWCFLYILLFIIFFIVQKTGYRTLRTPLTFFCGLWSIVGFCANSPILGYTHPSTLVNISILVGNVVFFCVFIGLNKSVTNIREDMNFGTQHSLNMPVIIILNAVGWLILLPRLLNSFQLISQYGFSFVRANLQNTELGISRGGIQDIIFSYMVEPIFNVTGIVATFEMFARKRSKRSILLFIYSVVSIVMFTLTSAGRGTIVKFIFYVVFTTMICRTRVIKAVLSNRVFRYGILGAAAVVLIVSVERSFSTGEESMLESWLKSFYVYYFSGPAFMTKLIEAQPQYAFGGELMWGSATFGFITNWFAYLILMMTGQNVGSDYILGSVISNHYYQVAPGISLNAMYTCFYTFAIDWGYLGMFIGPCILAAVSSFLFKKTYRKGDYRYAVIYVTWLYVLIRTLFKLDTLSVSYAVALACAFLFIRRENGTKRT